MNSRNNILLILTILLCSCNEKAKNNIPDPKIDQVKDSKLKTENDTEQDIDISISAELFAKEVLKENLRKHIFEEGELNRPKHTEIFDNAGLINIIAYSNSNYPKHSKANRYEHFTFFMANYQSELNALKTFALITMTAKENLPEYQLAQKKFVQRVKSLNIGDKKGGMIIQSRKHIFSLVETCREVQIGETWIDYENKFIGYIVKNKEEIEVLNSDCGMGRYLIEKRRASR